MSDPTLPAELAELRDRVSAFVREVVIPAEAELGLARRRRSCATGSSSRPPRRACSPRTSPEEHGGLGLDMFGQSVVFEAAGYSLLGPLALNCAAPDEGNMHLLSVIATDEQKARYLRPLAAGEIRSCFAMTEPAPGAGSDPAALRDDGDAGRRRLADRRPEVADHRRRGRRLRDRDGPHRRSSAAAQGATMFLVDAGDPGLRGRARDPDARPRDDRRPLRGRLRGLPSSTRRRSSASSTSASATPRCGSRPRG